MALFYGALKHGECIQGKHYGIILECSSGVYTRYTDIMASRRMYTHTSNI